MTTYTLAGGCFWCLDAVFCTVRGIRSSFCGYTGGDANNANYHLVATGHTGHAEAVQITFDERVISKDIVLDLFFLLHDPTTLNRQGADEGRQYRSAMFYADDAQKTEFEAAITRAQTHWTEPIVTSLEPLKAFYEAEVEHQNYFANNPESLYCSVVIAPKILKARQKYQEWLKEN